jgi:hypothetical protein
MPELRLKEVRLPELRLPEMSKDDIARAIGDARRIDLPEVDLPRIDLSKVDLPRLDVPKAVASATQAAGLVRSARRPRLPFIIGGLVTLALVGFALLNSPAVKPRLAEAARRARERMDERRAARMPVDALTDEFETTSDAASMATADAFADPVHVDAPLASEVAGSGGPDMDDDRIAIPIEPEPARAESTTS